ADIRGEFKPVASNVPGIQVCEHLPRMAQWMHKAVIVRSVNHKAGCHNPMPSYTGYGEMLPDGALLPRATYPPSMGSVCEYLKKDKSELPASVYLPCYLGWGQMLRRPGPYGGFLGKGYDPFFTECDPTSDDPPPANVTGDAVQYYPRVVRG